MWNKLIFISFLSLIVCSKTFGQTIPVGFPLLESYTRRLQLSDTSISYSMGQRPISPDSIAGISLDPQFNFGDLNLGILPIQNLTSHNSHHPISQNDGSLIPGNGWQNLTSIGVYGEYRFIKVQFRPEFHWSQNLKYPGFPDSHNHHRWERRYLWWNRSDDPEYFGEGSISQMNWGQSSAKVYWQQLELGVSNENIWWGPGVRNSLLLSNNAPGFFHVTLNTNAPIKTNIGQFEGQLIGGKLSNSGFNPTDSLHIIGKTEMYAPPPDKGRFLSGLHLNYSPKWTPGLFIGLIATEQQYMISAKERFDYLSVLTNPFQKKTSDTTHILKPDRYFSLYARYVWRETKTEFFGEIGNKSNEGLLSNGYFKKPAYNFGVIKLFDLSRKDQSIEVLCELTQLALQDRFDIQQAGSWYVSDNVRQGYTHQGQWLGARIGPGSNSQYVSISWVNQMNKIGLSVERILHNNDWYYHTMVKGFDFRSTWADLNVGLIGQFAFKGLLIDSEVLYTRSFNYQWELIPEPDGVYYSNGTDTNNLYIKLNLAYIF